MKIPRIPGLFSSKPVQSTDVVEERVDLGPKEVYMTWESLTSVQDKRGIDKSHIRAFTIIGIFVGLLLLIMQEFFIILIIGSLIFFTQAILRMNPENVKYEISSHGISIGDTMYYWNQLVRFFFIQRENTEAVAVDTTLGFPGRIFMPFQGVDKGKLKEILEKHIHFLESEPKTFLDNAYDRVVKRFSVGKDLDKLKEEIENKQE